MSFALPEQPRICAAVADWARERKAFWAWDPPKALLASIRAYQRHRNSTRVWAPAGRFVSVMRHRVWSVVTGAEIPLNCQLAGGLMIPHPNGIVLHPAATVGPNCLLMQQVTIGVGPSPGVPRLGGHVDVGAGARILGGVTIGDHARIGANAVVLIDVPAGATAVGVPARIVQAGR